MLHQPTPPGHLPVPRNRQPFYGLMKTHWFPLIRPAFLNPYFCGGYVRGDQVEQLVGIQLKVMVDTSGICMKNHENFCDIEQNLI